MDLTTSYLGLSLTNPIVVSSSKLTGTIDNIRACAKAGAGAIVLKSIFEEQLIADIQDRLKQNEMYFWYPEAVDYVQSITKGKAMDDYLRLIRQSKKEVSTPIIASVHCVSPIEWPHFAAQMQDAGADAIELNIAIFPFDPTASSLQIEDTYIDIVKSVKENTSLPISVKVGPFFTNMLAMAYRLNEAGANGLVLFNRFYNPDVDIASQKVITDNIYSAPDEKSIAMRWIALLFARQFQADLAASTGIHYSIGVAKQLLAGATVTQICTTLYQNGIPYLKEIVKGLEDWMKKNGFKNIESFRGMVSKYPENKAAFERLQYMKKNFD